MRIIFFLFMLLACSGAFASERPAIVPAPADYRSGVGSLSLPAEISVGAADSRSGKSVATVVRYLNRAGLKARKGGSPLVKVKLDTSLAPEAYTLDVTPQNISIAASTESGLMYAVESLAQLASAGDGVLGACSISDSPRFEYRGMMLDVVRCYLPADEIKRIIDVAAKLKINNLHLHLTDDNGWRVEIKKYPRLTEIGAWRVDRPELFPGRLNARNADEEATYGGYYTQKELRELVKYAADRNINIIPEIDMPAHMAAAIASYPDLACPVVDKYVGVFPGIGGKDASIILCAGKEQTFDFITGVLDEIMDIFPSEYIHLGGDEANKSVWRECPLCNARIEHEGLDGHEALQAYLMDRVNHYVISKGRKSMGWDEVTHGNPKEDIVVFGWQGDGGVAVRDSRKSGRRFVLTPAKTLYLIRYQGPQWFEPWTYFGNNTLYDVYNYEPYDNEWTDELKQNLMGVQASMWTEFCRTPQQVQYQLFPRLIAAADMAWRPEGTADWDAFMPALDNFNAELERLNIVSARSMYNLSHKVNPADGALNISLDCIRPDVETRWALNDSTFSNYSVYGEPLLISEPGTVYAATFRNGKPVGRVLGLKLDFNKATGRTVNSANCRNGLTPVLTNGLRASDRNSDFEWAGWYNDNAEFVVDLGEKQQVNSVSLGTLVHSDICVAAPLRVYLFTSTDGNAYSLQSQTEIDTDLVYHKRARVLDIDCPVDPHQARYLKFVAINPGCVPDGMAREGSPTWMYFDEVSVN